MTRQDRNTIHFLRSFTFQKEKRPEAELRIKAPPCRINPQGPSREAQRPGNRTSPVLIRVLQRAANPMDRLIQAMAGLGNYKPPCITAAGKREVSSVPNPDAGNLPDEFGEVTNALKRSFFSMRTAIIALLESGEISGDLERLCEKMKKPIH